MGRILPNQTVKGGTGWGAEFAKLCNKPLFVFDQEKQSWFRWSGQRFAEQSEPCIEHAHFCGSGTRFLAESGQQAIDELFARSLG